MSNPKENIALEGLSDDNRERLELFLLGVTIFILAISGGYVNSYLEFDRTLLDSGQWWRLLSCNIVHLNTNHMMMNVAGFVLATLLFKPAVNAWLWYMNFFICCLAVGLGIYIFDTPIQHYVGLSGALYGVLACGALFTMKKSVYFGGFAFVFVCVRVLSQQGEQFDSAHMIDFIDGHVVASSHLFGFIAGTLFTLVVIAYTSIAKRKIESK